MLAEGYQITIQNQDLLLLPQKAIWLKAYRTLLISDVHLGKGGHFRKSGIAIPKQLAQEDLANLSDIIDHYQPQKIIFLGDLFHSDFNTDWDWFKLWRELHHNPEILLIKGNHDILPDSLYQQLNIEVKKEETLGPFLLVHDLPKNKQDKYVISGHIHPGITVSGKGRQKLTVSCFYFKEDHAILPAFGRFTGKFCLKSDESVKIYAIAGTKIFKI